MAESPGIVFLAGLGGQWVWRDSPCISKDWRALTCRANVRLPWIGHGKCINGSTSSCTNLSWRSEHLQIQIHVSQTHFSYQMHLRLHAVYLICHGGSQQCHEEDNTKTISVNEFDKALRTYNFPRKTKHLSPVTGHQDCHWRHIYVRDRIPFLSIFTGLRMWIDLDPFGR